MDLKNYFDQVAGDVVGYDNNDISIGVVPALTTVDNRLKEAGDSIAEELLSLIKGEKDLVRRFIVPSLVERQSHKISSGPTKSWHAKQRRTAKR